LGIDGNIRQPGLAQLVLASAAKEQFLIIRILDYLDHVK
jgi:hypothetical protein